MRAGGHVKRAAGASAYDCFWGLCLQRGLITSYRTSAVCGPSWRVLLLWVNRPLLHPGVYKIHTTTPAP